MKQGDTKENKKGSPADSELVFVRDSPPQSVEAFVKSLVDRSGVTVKPAETQPAIIDDDRLLALRGMKSLMNGQQATMTIADVQTLSWTAGVQDDARSLSWGLTGTAEFILAAVLFSEFRVLSLNLELNYLDGQDVSANTPNYGAWADDPDGTATSLTLTELSNYRRPALLQARLNSKTHRKVIDKKLYDSCLIHTNEFQPGGWISVTGTDPAGQCLIFSSAQGAAASVTAKTYAHVMRRFTVQFRNRST